LWKGDCNSCMKMDGALIGMMEYMMGCKTSRLCFMPIFYVPCLNGRRRKLTCRNNIKCSVTNDFEIEEIYILYYYLSTRQENLFFSSEKSKTVVKAECHPFYIRVFLFFFFFFFFFFFIYIACWGIVYAYRLRRLFCLGIKPFRFLFPFPSFCLLLSFFFLHAHGCPPSINRQKNRSVVGSSSPLLFRVSAIRPFESGNLQHSMRHKKKL